MNHSKTFILKNLLKLKNFHGGIDEEALDKLVEAFRDELYHLREQDELSQNYEHGSIRREEGFTERAENKLLSINQ